MKISVIRVGLTIGFSSPQPFEFEEIVEIAASQGFSRPRDKSVTFAFDSRGLQMKIDRLFKGKMELGFNSDKGHLTINTQKLNVAMEGIKQAIEILNKALGETPPVIWHELNYHAKVRPQVKPLETKIDSKVPKKIEDLLGMQIRPFTRDWCAFVGDTPNKPLNEIPDWVHISITPFVQNPRYYYANVVYRRSDFKLVEGFISEVDALLKEIIKQIEGDN